HSFSISFYTHPASSETYPLSLHDALPILEWPDAHSHLKVALQKNWYERLLESALVHSPELRRFERSSHDEILARFRRLDVLKQQDRKSTRLNSSHVKISYAVFCLKKKKQQ